MFTETRLAAVTTLVLSFVVSGTFLTARQPRQQSGDPFTVDTIEQRFTARDVPDIVIRNPTDGQTTVRANGGGEVRVRAVTEVRGASDRAEAERVAERVEVRIRQEGNRVSTEVRRTHPYRWFSWGRQPQVLVHIEIEAPRRSDIDAKNDDGLLSVSGFEGRLALAVDDGDLLARDISGELTAVGDDGNLDLRQVHGSVDVKTDDGDLLAMDVSGELTAVGDDGNLDLRQVNGSVDVRIDDGDLRLDGILTVLRANADDGDLHIRAEAGSRMQADWSIHTDDGSVTVALPENFAADLILRTDDGVTRVDQPITVGAMSRHRISGELNGGGRELRVSSDDGRITISR